MKSIKGVFEISDNDIKEIESNIEKNRKGNFTINLPKNAKSIKVKQIKHSFKFGANLFMLDEIKDSNEKNELYKQKFAELFNMATLPFYWNDLEPEQGKTRYEKGSIPIYRRPAPDLCIEFCEKYGIEPREHALAYEHMFPNWLKDKTKEEVIPLFEKRCQEIATRYKDKIPTIEVTNEMFWNSGISKWYFDPDYVKECFALASKYFPKNELCINEWSGVWLGNDIENTDSSIYKYYKHIQNVLDNKIRLDAVGLQFHMFYKEAEYLENTKNYYSYENLKKAMNYFDEFNKPLEVTEITIPAYHYEDLLEEQQADIIELLYSIWFSHKSMKQIIYWNLVDGYAAFTEAGNMNDGENIFRGGLLRFDMTEKPAYKRLKYLLNEKWHTEEIFDDPSDSISFRGFYGTYEIECDGKKYIVNLDKNQTITL